jgi:uncharacterized membrane protein
MDIILLILIYIVTVIFSRFLNWILFKVDKGNPVYPWLWVVPVFNVLFMIIFIVIECIILVNKFLCDLRIAENFWKRFSGKNW